MEPAVRPTFMLEDTNEGCYRDVSAALVARGYAAVPFQRRVQQKKKKAQFKYGVAPSFIWAISERDLDYSELLPFQIVNHFDGISKLTTKQGLCEILRGMPWLDEHDHDICPRAYDLSIPAQRAEFADDFRLSAACNILKHCSTKKTLSQVTVFGERVIRMAITAISAHLCTALHGDWSGMLPNGRLGWLDRGDFGLLDGEWAEVLRASYDLAAVDSLPEWCLGEIFQRDDILLPSVTQLKIRLLLRGLQQIWPQLYMSGMRNIWIVKAPVVSRGTGIKLCSRLEDIFDLEKRIAGRIVQKYVETPLLVPRTPTFLNNNSNLSLQVKFDTRIWVAVTSFQPLKAFIYSAIYGRRCSKPYVSSIKSLNDDLIHLTNYSVQKNAAGVASSVQMGNSVDLREPAESSVDESAPVSLVERLRGAVKKPVDGRKCQTSAVRGEVNLLVTHGELMDFLDFKCNGMGREVWTSNIWPEVRRRVSSLLKASREHVMHRDKSFELLGVDVIFDDRLVPWVLEANMSPGLSHRNEQHNRLIESMIEGLMKKLLNDPPANVNSTSFPCEGGDLGAWEPLDTTTREGTDGESYDKRWRGIPVNIPNSRYHLISGEGKINKTWLDVLRSGSLSATISGTLCEETAVTGGGDDDTVSVSEKSYLRDKFSGLRSSSFLRESNSCEEETRGLVEGRDMEIISAVMGGRGDSVKPAASASIEWSMGLRGDRPRSASAVNAKSRFITTSKKDLLKVVAAANTTSNGDKNPAGMTATESRLHLYNQMNVAFDPSTFVAVGAAISKQALFALDYIIDACDKIYLLQRWARRFIIRLRAYHERRWLACTVIQCMVRQALARVKVMALVRQRAVVAVQTQMRMYLAGLELERRRRRRASALLGSQIYKFVIKNRKRKWLVDGRAKTIQRFLHLCMHRYYNKRAMIIGRQARRWVTVRWRHRRVVRHTIALFYRHRVLAAMTIKRSPLMKLFLKYLQTKRRRRRHLLRLTTAQARKPNKGLRHVVTVNVKMHVVVIDHGDEFSPLFRYNTVTRQDNNGGTVAEGSVPIDPEEAIQNFPLAQKKNSVSSFGINFTPAASKALDLVNSMLEASEISQKNKRDQEVMDALMNRSERARQFTATGEARAGDVFDILDFVCKHADGDASREDRPLPPPLPKKSISFSLGKIGASPSPVFNSRDCMDNFAVGFASAVTPAQDRLATASISSPDEQSDENGNEQSGEEERLFQNGQLRMYSASDLPMNRHLVTSKPPAEMQLTLDGFDDVSDTEKLGNGEEESMELDLIKEIHHMHQKHSEPIRHRLCNQELDQPRIRQEYEMPPRLSLMHPPQRDEDLEYVDHPPDSPGLSDEMDSEDDFMQEQERRIQMGRAPKPKKRAVAKKSKSAKSLRGPVKPPPRDPDEIYREQLERQLSEAKAKYAQKQMKRQADAYYRQSDIIRGESTPFDTRVRPQEPVWDTRNTTLGINSKLIEKEKAVALQQGAQWDSELQLQKEEKERKRLRAQAVDGRRRASAAAKEVVTSAAKRDLPINNVGLSDHLYVPLPEETRAKVRPKSAGNAGSRHRLASNGNRDNGFGEWPDGYGGYLVGPSEAPIERSTMHSEFGSACPKGPSSPGRGVSTRPKHANGGKIDERMSYTNQRDRASAGSKPPPPTENRPKSAGPVGASGRRQATRKAQHSDDVAHSTFDGSCNNHLPSQDAVSHGYSESLWTAKAGATTTEFSAEVLSQIEEELTNVDPTDLRRPSNFNRSTELDSDSEDDLEAAMAKWMRKQEVKASRGQTSSRLHVTEDLSSERSSRAASKSMTSASRNQSASRFNFDEGGGNRSTGPFRGASEAIDVVTNGYSSHIVSGVKIPVASLLQKQFASISELQEERERRQYQIDNGFTAAYSEAARAAEERTRHALYQGVPEDQFQTYLYDRRIDDSLLGETASTFGGPSNNKGSSSRPPPPMRLPLKENRPKMGPVTQHERMHSQQAAAIFQEVDVEIFGTLPPRYGEMVQSGRSSYFEQDMSAELTLNDAHFDVSSDPLQSSVQKLRSAYSGLTWDF